MKTKKRSEFSKLPSGDKTLLIIAYAILGLFLVAIILPIIYIILASFIDPVTLQNSGLTFDFSKWTLLLMSASWAIHRSGLASRTR